MWSQTFLKSDKRYLTDVVGLLISQRLDYTLSVFELTQIAIIELFLNIKIGSTRILLFARRVFVCLFV